MSKEKKGMTIPKLCIFSGISLATIIAMGIGRSIAYNYEGLLDVYFTRTNYEPNADEKALCEDVVEEGLVLLKNENKALPLANNEKKVALFGQNSVDFVYGGSGSGSIDSSKAPTLKDALENDGLEVNETLWNFYKTGAGSSYRKQMPGADGHGIFAVNEVPLEKYSEEVKASFKNSDVAICSIGRAGGESSDLPSYELGNGYNYLQIDKNERDMLKQACENFKKVILLVNTNNPVELGFLEEKEYQNIQGVIWCGGVGQEGVHGIANVIVGKANPSGKLVDTYAYDAKSAPSFQNLGDYTYSNSSVTNGTKYLVYGEGIYVGYRYYETRYEDVILGNTTGFDYSQAVQYPFGYGLSYTNFSYSDYEIKENEKEGTYTVSLLVKNEGNVAGKDVVEVYLQKPYIKGGVEKASIELVGYQKTGLLNPGNTQKLEIVVNKKSLASYDYVTNKTYILDPGDYYLAIGENSHDALNNILALKGKHVENGMDYEGNKELAKVVLKQDSLDKTTFSKSEVTNQIITNQLDDVDINHYEEYQYLTRSDWQGSFPTTYKNGSFAVSDKLLNDLRFYDVNLDTSDDETINSFVFKTDSTDTTYKVQEMVDASYDDERWDKMIDQLSYKQMTKLIRLGGYSTQQIDRIGLPSTQDKDGTSGISGTLVSGASAMAWPAEVVMASTWNDEMIENLGVRFGEDSISCGVAGAYAPGADIHRSPFSGRNFEYYSEDPYLSGMMAASEIKGLRSKGVIVYAKHFALNDQETNRYGCSNFANEQAVREIYLKGFEYAVKYGKTNGLMAAMNRIGSRWVGAHKGLMNNILRNEWGFEGMVITDQASVPAMFYQDIVSGLWAGTDLWLNTNSSYWSLDAYREDKTMQYYIHRAAKNIVYAISKSWAVDERFKDSSGEGKQTVVSILPWRSWLTAAEVTIYTLGAVGILLPTGLYIAKKVKKGRKNSQE